MKSIHEDNPKHAIDIAEKQRGFASQCKLARLQIFISSELDIHIPGVYHERNTMHRGTTTMHRRINVTLPEETVKLIDRVSTKGDRSRLIDHAVKQYITEIGRANLRKKLKEGALRRSSRDLALAEEWSLLEDATWPATKR